MRLPITLKPRPSRALGAALVVAHGLAALGLVTIAVAVSLKVLAGIGLLLSLAVALRRHVLQPGIVALTLRADGLLDAHCADGSSATVAVQPHTTAFPWLVVLLVKIDGRACATTLLPDSLGGEDFRQLRLWLRWLARPA